MCHLEIDVSLPLLTKTQIVDPAVPKLELTTRVEIRIAEARLFNETHPLEGLVHQEA